MTLVTFAEVLLVVLAFIGATLGGALTAKKLGLEITTSMQLCLMLSGVVCFFCLVGAAWPGVLGSALLAAFSSAYLSHRLSPTRKDAKDEKARDKDTP